MALGTLALVGSPSSGKSTIFNRIIGERKSIVEPTPGVTRDRIYAKATWLTKEFTVIDTGGIEVANAPFQKSIRAQVEIAMEEADVIAFVLDGKKGLSGDDRFIAKMLYQTNKPKILLVNKVDNVEEVGNIGEFYRLGLGDPLFCSGAHGIGIGDFLDKVIKLLPEKEIPSYEDAITFSIIGRPNVGKSSLTNRLLHSERTLVSDIAGTTRDSIDTPFTHEGKNYVVIDTASLVKRGKIFEAIDKYAAIRALNAIDRSEVVLFVIDGSGPLLEQDKHVLGYAMDAKKAVIVVVNKWDEGKKKNESKQAFTKELRTQLKFLEYAPIVYTSALTGSGVEDLFPLIEKCHEAFHRRISTPVLNDIIRDAQDMNPTPEFNHGRLKIVFAEEVSVCPPTFVMFCNNPKTAHFSYTRYLENRIRETFDFEGTPINIIYRARK